MPRCGGPIWRYATGLTAAQLYSTASYKAKDLTGIGLGYDDLTGWNFTGQNLTNADFTYATLTGANLANAQVRGACFGYVTGLTAAQLYSTASYLGGDMSGIQLFGNGPDRLELRRQEPHRRGFFFHRHDQRESTAGEPYGRFL